MPNLKLKYEMNSNDLPDIPGNTYIIPAAGPSGLKLY